MFEFLQLGARLRSLAGLCGIPLFHLGLALRDDFGDGFPLRIDKQILQILIRKRGNPFIRPIDYSDHSDQLLFELR